MTTFRPIFVLFYKSFLPDTLFKKLLLLKVNKYFWWTLLRHRLCKFCLKTDVWLFILAFSALIVFVLDSWTFSNVHFCTYFWHRSDRTAFKPIKCKNSYFLNNSLRCETIASFALHKMWLLYFAVHKLQFRCINKQYYRKIVTNTISSI